MSLILYERVGHEGRRPSPFSWRIRYALRHKGVAVDYVPMRFADVETVRRLSGQHMVPVLVDGDRVVHDSWNIAVHLEERFPDRPPLFGNEAARGMARFITVWADTALAPLMRRLIYADFVWCLDAGDRAYFRQSRERELGMTLEEACADRATAMASFRRAMGPLERTLAGQAFLGGAAPTYADYAVFSFFQWARLGSPGEILSEDSAVHAWRARMIGLFDGLGDLFAGYPAPQDAAAAR
ncbi:glutathione S-transferase family protein [Vineibacter terrae]|uniref:Glutathione S-transferase family protein n=1 Tax=Vineibacter terrae TaxID=2586908 RepID=A0A5C8PUS9_9HYPH|nr:glutathione S-transferase N-terminal domain-containing protein [Vineibacter terrae]TXL81600.1 glutathione S-transferase family protein [Vineibacter terrae]